MKKIFSMLFMVFVASVLFAQTYSFKSADKNPCKVTLNGDTIIIEETLFGGYINRITIPKNKFTSTKAQVTSEEGGKSVINNQPHMESSDMIYIIEDSNNTSIVGYLSGRAVYQQKSINGIWLYKKDIATIAKKLKL